eukprot:1139683-Pelagomonas_calceolata.AAC.4
MRPLRHRYWQLPKRILTTCAPTCNWNGPPNKSLVPLPVSGCCSLKGVNETLRMRKGFKEAMWVVLID